MRLAERVRRRFQIFKAHDWSFVPGGRASPCQVRQHLTIAPRPMASVDYYIADLIQGGNDRLVFDADIERHRSQSILPGTRVVLVRMPDPGWGEVLHGNRASIVDVVWLIDDDVLAARDDLSLPPDYRLRLLSDYLGFRAAYQPLVTHVWASTPRVAERYPADKVSLRPPSLPARERPRHDWVTIFYHGTASHRPEHEFLRQVFARLQVESTRTVIEVCGDHSLRRLYQGIPRVRVVHPMAWPDYLPLLEAGRYDIGLVPLLDTPFNRGRSGIKALEIASIGAAGVLSRRAPYTEYAHLPGMHLASDEPAEWVERILTLVNER